MATIIDYCPPRKGITSTDGLRLITITGLRNLGYTGLSSSNKIADIDTMFKAGVPYSNILGCLDSNEYTLLITYLSNYPDYLYTRNLSLVKEILSYHGGSDKTSGEDSYPDPWGSIIDDYDYHHFNQDYVDHIAAGTDNISETSLSDLKYRNVFICGTYIVNYDSKYGYGDADFDGGGAGGVVLHGGTYDTMDEHAIPDEDRFYIYHIKNGSRGSYVIAAPYYDPDVGPEFLDYWDYAGSDWFLANAANQYLVIVGSNGIYAAYEYNSQGTYLSKKY